MSAAATTSPKRPRSHQVCVECHNRKVKCDLELHPDGQPCANCKIRGRSCEIYTRRQRRSHHHTAPASDTPSPKHIPSSNARDSWSSLSSDSGRTQHHYATRSTDHPRTQSIVDTDRTRSPSLSSLKSSTTRLSVMSISTICNPMSPPSSPQLRANSPPEEDDPMEEPLAVPLPTRKLRSRWVCKECHKRKVKCDFAQRPAGRSCSNCEIRGDICEPYSRRQRKKRGQQHVGEHVFSSETLVTNPV